MKRISTIGLFVAAVATCLANTASADHDFDYKQIGRLAHQVQDRANALCWEMYRHHRHHPNYRQTYRQAYEVLSTAKYVHELAHTFGRPDRIREQVDQMHDLMHDVGPAIRDWADEHHGNGPVYYNPSPYDPWHGGGFHGGGHFDGGALKRKLDALANEVHHLMSAVGIERRPPNRGGAGSGDGTAPPPDLSQPGGVTLFRDR